MTATRLRVAASSAAWGWSCETQGRARPRPPTIPKACGLEAATPTKAGRIRYRMPTAPRPRTLKWRQTILAGRFPEYNVGTDERRPVRRRDGKAVLFEGRGMRVILTTTILLCCSFVFMTFAWYGHLKNLSHRPWIPAALASWGIAFFEYIIQVPANRIGHEVLNVGQLKILQEVVTLTVFVPLSLLYLKEQLRMDYLWAGLCILAAVFFIFRQRLFGA